jgi:hypothetical protein
MKHCKDFYLLQDFWNIYLHNNILQHLFGSKLSFSNFPMEHFENILKIFYIKQSPKHVRLAPSIMFALTYF